MRGAGMERQIALFLMTNLKRSGEVYYFDLPLNTFKDFISSQSVRPFPEDKSSTSPCLLVRGAESEFITDNDFDLFRKYYCNFTARTVEKAGHWVHAQQPTIFTNIVSDFICSV
jgi:esterase